MDVTVVDLGLGNLRSVLRALERAGASPTLTRDGDVVRRANRVVVPGQGAFRDAARAIDGPLGEALVEAVRVRRVPYFGICLGMQVLFEASEEAPGARGLAWLRGDVRRFPRDHRSPAGERLKVPHMGWNRVRGAHPFLPDGEWYYFTHSYHAVPVDPSVVVGTAEYGYPFAAAVAFENVFACQFHPEKSQGAGERLLTKFMEAM